MPDINAWLQSVNADPIILVEAEHGTGTLYLATQPFVSSPHDTPANAVYDDFIVDGVTLSSAIGANREIGEITFYWQDSIPSDWINYRLYIGDSAWPRNDFELLSSGIIERATRPGRNQIRLEIADASAALDVAINSTQTFSGTVQNVSNQILALAGLGNATSVNFENFQDTASITLTSVNSDTYNSLLQQAAESIGAFFRVDLLGSPEIVFIPSTGTATLTLTDDDVALDGFSQGRIEDAANVTLEYNGGSVRVDNGAKNEITIRTALKTNNDAQTEAARRGALRASPREVWRFNVFLPGLLVTLGQRVQIDVADAISATGTITGWRKRPDRKLTEIEIIF